MPLMNMSGVVHQNFFIVFKQITINISFLVYLNNLNINIFLENCGLFHGKLFFSLSLYIP